VPAAAAADTLVCTFNDVDGIRAAVEGHGDRLAAIIVEPVAGNMGVVPPEPGFLEALRALCDASGALLVFDEVISGFRVARGGAQELYGVIPDLTVLGKIAGGGLPLAAFGGRAEVMDRLAPAGPVYQAGTLSGNPLAMTAGIQTLRALAEPGVWDGLERAGERLVSGLTTTIDASVQVTRVGTMFGLFFTDAPVYDWEDARRADTARFATFHRGMLERGVYLAPSQFEAAFVSTAHGDHEIDETIAAAREAFAEI
jgi:glutamate-1-semialdehyde 2,1-aminomutase